MLTKDQINKLQDRLLEMKKEHESHLPGEENRTDEETGELSNADNHPGDQGTELHEREKDVALENQSREQLQQVNQALEAIDEGTYGRCEICGEKIPYERLEAVPETSRCVHHADQTSNAYRPVEEDYMGASEAANDVESVVFDDEDTWDTVSEHGTSQTPSDLPESNIDYSNNNKDH
ncbi:YteA family regulatory protein [Geomicrobium halophilum]|uniref:YteA family regulatory protein n=1 Tax=Geomicrobium halophilum TaxID=549000 RepID=A0A841PIE9_9BACL|nr:TraR/DksA C4-type zinc finger protein [Geomicrobium halophilum]MBB6448519.1 YteA family regulatory protein [Geomicrobium halophilum]